MSIKNKFYEIIGRIVMFFVRKKIQKAIEPVTKVVTPKKVVKTENTEKIKKTPYSKDKRRKPRASNVTGK